VSHLRSFWGTVKSAMPTHELPVFGEHLCDMPSIYEHGDLNHHHAGPWTAVSRRPDDHSCGLRCHRNTELALLHLQPDSICMQIYQEILWEATMKHLFGLSVQYIDLKSLCHRDLSSA